MATATTKRSVTVDRSAPGRFTVTNVRGGKLAIGSGSDDDFTPTELLLAAIGSCTALDVYALTARRAEPDSFHVLVDAVKIRDEEGNRLTDIEVTFRVAFPGGEPGNAAGALLPDAVRRSHARLCTVGRTVEAGTPIATHID